MFGTLAGVALIIASVAASGLAIYFMAISENYIVTVVKCIPIMFTALILLLAGAVVITA